MPFFEREARISSDKSYFLDQARFGLGDFICLDCEQREDLLRVMDMVRVYILEQEKKRPLNIYIEAPPGSGKTFLAKQICKAVEETISNKKINFLTFNLTYIDTPSQLIEAFRKTQDSFIKGEMPVMFFDEADSKIGQNSYAYPLFLTPMYDGKVYERGDQWNIGPAIFFFAASKKLKDLLKISRKNDAAHQHGLGLFFAASKKLRSLLKISTKDDASEQLRPGLINEDVISEPADKNLLSYENWTKKERAVITDRQRISIEGQPEKLNDFLDRIDEFVFLPPSNVLPNGKKEDAQEQACYIAISLLLSKYPFIELIEKAALGILEEKIISTDSRRFVESCIFKSWPPCNNVFELKNLPENFVEEYEHLGKKLRKNEYVRIGYSSP